MDESIVHEVYINQLKNKSRIIIGFNNIIGCFSILYVGGGGDLILRNSEFDIISITSPTNDTYVSLEGIKKVNTLELEHITTRILFDDLTINSLSIRNCDFTNWKFGYIDWTKNFALKESSNVTYKNDEEKYLELLESSRLLKDFFQKKGNNIYSNIFRKSELRSYYYLLKSKIFNLNFSSSQLIDFIILATNKWFSNFGNDPVRSLTFLIIFHTFWFYLLVNSNNDIPFSFCFDLTENCGLGFYLSLLNPVHKLIDSEGGILYSTVDFLMRISSGYFIYYFLKSTRKFTNT